MDSLSTNIKRIRHDSDSGTEKDAFGLELENVSPPKRIKKWKKPSFKVNSKEMTAFFRLLDDPLIYEFLCADLCKRISDKYLLAMVFAYFKRASLTLREFSRTNFFVALYLANDMEEDEEDFKYEIFPWAVGPSWKHKYMSFLQKRDKFWKKIDYRAAVSNKCCDEIMTFEPNHWIWKRERPEHHAGALRLYQRDSEDDGFPRGPDESPRKCKECGDKIEYDSASPGNTSWYLSSSSDSSPDIPGGKTCFVALQGSYFNMEGLKQTLQEEDMSIWAHKEE